MFDIASTELLVCVIVAILVIGPKDLPRVLRTVGNWVGQARGVMKHFRAGVDTMIRESELEDMEKKWAAENDRIMKEFPSEEPMQPLPATDDVQTPGEPETGTAKTDQAEPTAKPTNGTVKKPKSPKAKLPSDAQPTLPLTDLKASDIDEPPA